MIFGDYPMNFRITCKKYCINFRENSWDFWNQLSEVLQVFWWNFGEIAKNFEEI